MFDQHHRHALFLPDVQNDAYHVFFFLDVHARHRLVEQQQLWGQGQGARHLDPFLHAITEGAHWSAAECLQLHEIDDLLDIGAVLGLDAAGLAVKDRARQQRILDMRVAGQQQVFHHCQAPEEFQVLKGAGDAKARYHVGRGAAQFVLAELDASFGRMVEAADAVEKAGLASAVGADDGDNFMFRHMQRDATQGIDPAEGERDILDVQLRHLSSQVCRQMDRTRQIKPDESNQINQGGHATDAR